MKYNHSLALLIIVFAFTCLTATETGWSETVTGGRVGAFIGNSTDTKPTPTAGETYYELDTGNEYVYDGDSWELLRGYEEAGEDTLSDPAADGLAIDVTGWDEVVVALGNNGTTSTWYCTYIILGKAPNSRWANVNADGDTISVTNSSSYSRLYSFVTNGGLDSMKVRWLEESSGTENTSYLSAIKIRK